MKYLFLLAHPDDEVVASGGTIRKLVDQGDEVKVVLATDGGAGALYSQGRSVKEFLTLYSQGQANDIHHSSIGRSQKKIVSQVRRKEFEKSCEILGVEEYKILDFPDGEINNKLVWGKLELAFIDEIEEYKPDVVVTFDHSGWYFHLDHVGVSIATLRAVQRSKHKVDALFFTLFHPPGIKLRWKYVYPKKLPITHEVDIKSVVKQKIKAVKAHKSQKISLVDKLVMGKMNKEYFQLVLATKRGKRWLEESGVFINLQG